MKTSVRLAGTISQMGTNKLKLLFRSWCKALTMSHKPSILRLAGHEVKVNHGSCVMWISTHYPILLLQKPCCAWFLRADIACLPTELTWAMSSKQLKMYFLASFDLIPVSASWSSGVWSREAKADW